MQGIIPEQIQNRMDKIGFETPEEKWEKEHSAEFRKMIEKSIERTNGIINSNAIEYFDRAISRGKLDFTTAGRAVAPADVSAYVFVAFDFGRHFAVFKQYLPVRLADDAAHVATRARHRTGDAQVFDLAVGAAGQAEDTAHVATAAGGHRDGVAHTVQDTHKALGDLAVVGAPTAAGRDIVEHAHVHTIKGKPLRRNAIVVEVLQVA